MSGMHQPPAAASVAEQSYDNKVEQISDQIYTLKKEWIKLFYDLLDSVVAKCRKRQIDPHVQVVVVDDEMADSEAAATKRAFRLWDVLMLWGKNRDRSGVEWTNVVDLLVQDLFWGRQARLIGKVTPKKHMLFVPMTQAHVQEIQFLLDSLGYNVAVSTFSSALASAFGRTPQ